MKLSRHEFAEILDAVEGRVMWCRAKGQHGKAARYLQLTRKLRDELRRWCNQNRREL